MNEFSLVFFHAIMLRIFGKLFLNQKTKNKKVEPKFLKNCPNEEKKIIRCRLFVMFFFLMMDYVNFFPFPKMK